MQTAEPQLDESPIRTTTLEFQELLNQEGDKKHDGTKIYIIYFKCSCSGNAALVNQTSSLCQAESFPASHKNL